MNLVALSDPRIAATPTVDNQEPMLPLRAAGRLFLDDSAANQQNLGYAHQFVLREGVIARLQAAAEALPAGIGLLIKETWRPAPFQAFIYQRRKQRLADAEPTLTDAALDAQTSRFIAPPHVAGHPTGGAFDVTLCDLAGNELDLGCCYDEDEYHSAGRCLSFATDLSPSATRHRHYLFAALQAQGFVNYPFEWWHWSYGDKYWAALHGAPHACYDAVSVVSHVSDTVVV